MVGKRNAAKKAEVSKICSVQFRCTVDDKICWVRTAQNEGFTLSAWIIEVLNKAKK